MSESGNVENGSVGGDRQAEAPERSLEALERLAARQGFAGVVLAATPIGNPADASPRLVELLRQADIVAAEDTRVLRKLASTLGVQLRAVVLAHHEHNERSSARELVEAAHDGALVAVVSDAGMPTVSDPGFRIVQEAIAKDVPVSLIPGPSAALSALALSGLATDRFSFEGFLPRKNGERSSRLAKLADYENTMIFFEAPHRVEAALTALVAAFGPERRAALARELTKTYEQVRRGSLAELLDGVREEAPRGEIVLVVAGADPAAQEEQSFDRAKDEAFARIAAGEKMSAAVKDVAKEFAVARKALYESVLREKQGGGE